MLNTIEQTLGKSCVIGLSYFDNRENLLKQSMLAGQVIKADQETGITIQLISKPDAVTDRKVAHFIIPAELSCWFIAPKGDFHTSEQQIKITDPDYLITWDIIQNRGDKAEGEQQWWQWRPRTTPPVIT